MKEEKNDLRGSLCRVLAMAPWFLGRCDMTNLNCNREQVLSLTEAGSHRTGKAGRLQPAFEYLFYQAHLPAGGNTTCALRMNQKSDGKAEDSLTATKYSCQLFFEKISTFRGESGFFQLGWHRVDCEHRP